MTELKAGFEWTDNDFDKLSLHDVYVSGLRFKWSEDDFINNIIFDLDYLVSANCSEICCGVRKVDTFYIAPAELTFFEVGSAKFSLSLTGGGFGIYKVIRKGPLQPPNCNFTTYQWTIDLLGDGGRITFSAASFKQVLLADPHPSECMRLFDDVRERLINEARSGG